MSHVLPGLKQNKLNFISQTYLYYQLYFNYCFFFLFVRLGVYIHKIHTNIHYWGGTGIKCNLQNFLIL